MLAAAFWFDYRYPSIRQVPGSISAMPDCIIRSRCRGQALLEQFHTKALVIPDHVCFIATDKECGNSEDEQMFHFNLPCKG